MYLYGLDYILCLFYIYLQLTNRTWQSLKETFIKRVLPDIHNPYYRLTIEQINSFRSGSVHHPSSIIVLSFTPIRLPSYNKKINSYVKSLD